MALITIGQTVSIQLRNGVWLNDMIVLGLLGDTITVKQSILAPSQNIDMVKDVVVISTTGGISI